MERGGKGKLTTLHYNSALCKVLLGIFTAVHVMRNKFLFAAHYRTGCHLCGDGMRRQPTGCCNQTYTTMNILRSFSYFISESEATWEALVLVSKAADLYAFCPVSFFLSGMKEFMYTKEVLSYWVGHFIFSAEFYFTCAGGRLGQRWNQIKRYTVSVVNQNGLEMSLMIPHTSTASVSFLKVVLIDSQNGHMQGRQSAAPGIFAAVAPENQMVLETPAQFALRSPVDPGRSTPRLK